MHKTPFTRGRLWLRSACSAGDLSAGQCWAGGWQVHVHSAYAEQTRPQTQTAFLYEQAEVNRPPVHLHSTVIQSAGRKGNRSPFVSLWRIGLDVGGCKWTHVCLHLPLHREEWRFWLSPPENLPVPVKGATVIISGYSIFCCVCQQLLKKKCVSHFLCIKFSNSLLSRGEGPGLVSTFLKPWFQIFIVFEHMLS